MNGHRLASVVIGLVSALSQLPPSSARACPVDGFTGPYDIANWTTDGIDGGTATVDTAVSDSTTAVFSYAVNLGGGGVSERFATFETVAEATGTVTFTWNYDWFHAWFLAEASLEFFAVDANDVVQVVPVYDQSISGSQTASGQVVDLAVTAGKQFGFRVGGSNFDSNSQLNGTVTLTMFTAATPCVADPAPEVAEVVADAGASDAMNGDGEVVDGGMADVNDDAGPDAAPDAGDAASNDGVAGDTVVNDTVVDGDAAGSDAGSSGDAMTPPDIAEDADATQDAASMDAGDGAAMDVAADVDAMPDAPGLDTAEDADGTPDVAEGDATPDAIEDAGSTPDAAEDTGVPPDAGAPPAPDAGPTVDGGATTDVAPTTPGAGTSGSDSEGCTSGGHGLPWRGLGLTLVLLALLALRRVGAS